MQRLPLSSQRRQFRALEIADVGDRRAAKLRRTSASRVHLRSRHFRAEAMDGDRRAGLPDRSDPDQRRSLDEARSGPVPNRREPAHEKARAGAVSKVPLSQEQCFLTAGMRQQRRVIRGTPICDLLLPRAPLC